LKKNGNGCGSGRRNAKLEKIVGDPRKLRRFLERALHEESSEGQFKELVHSPHLLITLLRTIKGRREFDEELVKLLFELNEKLEGSVVAGLLEYDDESLAGLAKEPPERFVRWLDGQSVEKEARLCWVAMRRCRVAIETLIRGSGEDVEAFVTACDLVVSQLIVGKIPMPVCRHDHIHPVLQGRTEFVSGPVLEDPREDFIPVPVEWEVVSVEACRLATDLVCHAISVLELPSDVTDLIGQIESDRESIMAKIDAVCSRLRLEAEGKSLPRWLPAGGLVRFCPELSGYGSELTRLLWVAVEPKEQIPALSFELRRAGIGPYGSDCWEMTADGELVFPETTRLGDQRALRTLLTLMILKAIECRVMQPREVRESCPEPLAHSGRSRGPVWPSFRRLPDKIRRDGKPYQASKKAIARAIKIVGYKPPEGMTFAASPPIRG